MQDVFGFMGSILTIYELQSALFNICRAAGWEREKKNWCSPDCCCFDRRYRSAGDQKTQSQIKICDRKTELWVCLLWIQDGIEVVLHFDSLIRCTVQPDNAIRSCCTTQEFLQHRRNTSRLANFNDDCCKPCSRKPWLSSRARQFKI